MILHGPHPEAPLALDTPIRSAWSTLPEALRGAAKHAPERGVHVYNASGSKEFQSWGQLMSASSRVAAALSAQGIVPEQKVLLCMSTSIEFISSFFGLLLLGAVPVPLSLPRQDARDALGVVAFLERLSQSIGVRDLLCDETLPVEQRPGAGAVAAFDRVMALDQILHGVPIGEVLWPGSDTQTAYIQLTSGTTDRPKGVLLSHENILTSVRSVGYAVELGQQDVGICWLPLDNIIGLVGFVCLSMYWGVDVVLMSPEFFLDRPHMWLRLIERHRATLTAAPDFGYYHCLRRANEKDLVDLDLSSLRVAMTGGEPVRARHMKMFADRFASCGFSPDCFVPVYGVSEGTLGVSFAPLNEPPRIERFNRRIFEKQGQVVVLQEQDTFTAYERMHLVSVGKPLPWVDVAILNEDGDFEEAGRLGHIVTRGPHVSVGYASTDRARTPDSWMRTGDVGFISSDGYLFFVERASDVLTTSFGRRIFPSEVELFVNSVDGVRSGSALVFFHPSQGTPEQLVIAYETLAGAASDEIEDTVRRALKKHLDLSVDRVVELSTHSVPKTRDGKTRRQAAQALFAKGQLDRKQRASELVGVLRLVNRARTDILRFGHNTKRRVGRLFERFKP